MNRSDVGSRWRVVATNASLEAAQTTMYGGGACATSFRKHPMAAGTILVYCGTRNFGSDGVDEDVFESESGIRGAFKPCVYGGAKAEAIAPETRGVLATSSGSKSPIELGPMLDMLPDDLVEAFETGADLAAYFAADVPTADLRAVCGASRIRPTWKVTVNLADGDLARYIQWRTTVSRIRKAASVRVALLVGEAGGRALPHDRWKGYYQSPFDSIFPADADVALEMGTVRRDQKALILTDAGRVIAEEQLQAAARRVALRLLEGDGRAVNDYRHRGGYHTNSSTPETVTFRDAKAAEDLGVVVRVNDGIEITDHGRSLAQ
jgi:hypothetical protein